MNWNDFKKVVDDLDEIFTDDEKQKYLVLSTDIGISDKTVETYWYFREHTDQSGELIEKLILEIKR